MRRAELCLISLQKQERSFFVEDIASHFDGTAVYEKQPEESPTPYAGMITKQMGLINFGKSARNWKDWCEV